MKMVELLENLLEVRVSPDRRYQCRVCGNRIQSGEQMILLHYDSRSVSRYWRLDVRHRLCRAAHLSCWMMQDTGQQFVMGVLEHLSDEVLVEMGLRVEHEAAPEPDTPFEIGYLVEPREPGSDCSFGNTFGEDWVGEVTRAPFDWVDGRRAIEVRWSRGSRSPDAWIVSPDEMRLVRTQPEPEAAAREIAVGDMVRLLPGVTPYGNHLTNGVYEVRSLNDGVGRNNHTLWDTDHRDYWYYRPEYLEFVSSSDEPDPTDEAPNLELRVGAQVRIVSGGCLTHGEVYPVVVEPAEPADPDSPWGIGEHGIEEPYIHRGEGRPGYWWIASRHFEVVG